MVTDMALQKHNRFPGAGLETPVDSLRLGLNISEQIMVPLDVGAAGGADLYEYKFALIRRAFLQHAFDRQKPLEDSFGVIDAIDAHAYKPCLHPKLSK